MTSTDHIDTFDSDHNAISFYNVEKCVIFKRTKWSLACTNIPRLISWLRSSRYSLMRSLLILLSFSVFALIALPVLSLVRTRTGHIADRRFHGTAVLLPRVCSIISQGSVAQRLFALIQFFYAALVFPINRPCTWAKLSFKGSTAKEKEQKKLKKIQRKTKTQEKTKRNCTIVEKETISSKLFIYLLQ